VTDAGGRSSGEGGQAHRARLAAARACAAAALAAVSVAIGTLGACGEEASRDYTGFWRAADVALADCTLVKVWEEGDAYLVRVDYGAPRPAGLGAEGLRVEADAAAAVSPGAGDDDAVGSAGAGDARDLACDLVLRRGTLVLVKATAGASPLEVLLRRVSEAAYEEELATLSDDRVRTELMELAAAVQAWAELHGGRPPAADLLVPGSEFARSLVRLGIGWPTNPFTAEPMHAGDGPGDFAYSTADGDFELVGYLSDGEAYVAE
jgi:hypothetical protein